MILASGKYIHLFIHSVMQQYLSGAYVMVGIGIQQWAQGKIILDSRSAQSGGEFTVYRNECKIQP